jgi:hypothetical protein
MVPAPTSEILGPRPWPVQLTDHRADKLRLTVLLTPYVGAFAAVGERYPRRDIAVLSNDPSIVEATLLVQAGADAYLSNPETLPAAFDALRAGHAWLTPVAAAAVCRLARLPGDPAFDPLAGAARFAAGGRPWLTVCRSLGLTDTRGLLAALRRAV